MYLVYTPDGIVLVRRYYDYLSELVLEPSSADLYLEAKVVGPAH